MIILLHVLIALASMAHTTYVYFRPTPGKLRGTYSLVALTMLSGFYLVFTKPTHIAEACTIGLVYLAVVSFGIAGATHKLATARVRSEKDQ